MAEVKVYKFWGCNQGFEDSGDTLEAKEGFWGSLGNISLAIISIGRGAAIVVNCWSFLSTGA